MVIVLNRFDECPEFITHVAYIDHGTLASIRCDVTTRAPFAELYQLLHLKTSELDVPMADPAARLPALNPSDPLVRLTGASHSLPRQHGLREPRLDDRSEPALAAEWAERQRQDVSAFIDHR